ncbi:DUF342 domain-containing protein [Lachnoclostridium phytofermentans]|uniref:Flagellar Assembly Protein A N-terminal region domain-containing protein n=1 Tax=Lachnoclostridium phytofermentans (strain ATCC 700394 / DSM 18823 / ISDg) TaxID=357809 RepID=A9KI26_LACP7|nr:FapA family protein [Lachnoclostridium phytofermentans]ABX40860.1 protein of unknown function DUF342 [Lachnoclostridium phytofermentans ISDg]
MSDWSRPTKELMYKKTKVDLRYDKMEAYITLYAPVGKDRYTKEMIYEILRFHHVIYGIDEEVVNKLCEKPCYGKEILIAKGKEEVDGKDGYFVYFFDTRVDTKPRILEDGSVDYFAMTRIVTVSQGEIIVRYHKAIQGSNGIDVCGSIRYGNIGRDLPPLKGKGFKLSDDRLIYTALITGKIEVSEGRITISNVLEIKENIDYLQGDIYFKGDLMIYGDISSGKVVESEGSIVVRGHVEGATIRAGKNVILENGMQGAGKGSITCGGSISGKFFEQVEMKAKENITANTIMNCTMTAGNEIIVTGRRGILLGGSAYAGRKITASIIGNHTHINTELVVGVRRSFHRKFAYLERKISELKERLSQVEAAIAMINERELPDVISPLRDQKMRLLRTKININSEIAEMVDEWSDLMDFIKNSKSAKIIVNKMIYPGCKLAINGLSMGIKQEIVSSYFLRNGDDIDMIPFI